MRCKKTFLVGGAGRKRKRQLFCSRKCRAAGDRLPNKMSEINKAWLAGLLDGEGTIVFYQSPSNHEVYRISIGNTFRKLIDKIFEVSGIGKITTYKSRNPKHNQVWYWNVCGENAKLLLKQMLPYLIVKKEKALKIINQIA